MKTAISLPDDTFEPASRRARDLGLSRSEFFARAANHYLKELDLEAVTQQIDAALERIGRGDASSDAAVDAGHGLLLDASSEW